LIDTKQQATIELLSVLVQSHYDITSVTRPPLSPHHQKLNTNYKTTTIQFILLRKTS